MPVIVQEHPSREQKPMFAAHPRQGMRQTLKFLLTQLPLVFSKFSVTKKYRSERKGRRKRNTPPIYPSFRPGAIPNITSRKSRRPNKQVCATRLRLVRCAN